MRYETVTVRHGENVGPVDWEHPLAKDMPQIWRDAEADPNSYTLNGRSILSVCMYDGWPYWKPMPAVHFVGPMGSGEWNFFNSYGVHPDSIEKRDEP